MSPRLSGNLIPRAVLVVYVGLLFLATLSPVPDTRTPFSLLGDFDKVAHVLLFGGLGAVLYWNLKISLSRGVGAAALAVSALVAALIEALQGPLPDRSAELWDFIAGVAGALLAVVVMSFVSGSRQ